MAFSFTATQNSAGTTIEISDTSTGAPISGSVRSFILTDYLDNPLVTLPLASDEVTVTYTIAVPTWINIRFLNTGTSPFDFTQRYGFNRVYEVLYQQRLQGSGGYGCGGSKVDFCAVDAFETAAAYAEPLGDAVNWQNYTNAAYALLQPIQWI